MQVPEHTMEGYRVAVGQGLPVIEQDVSTLADGGLGVMHDGTVDRMTTSSGNVADHTSVSDRKSTRLNSSHANISYAVFCLKKNKHRNSSSSTPHLLAHAA